MRTLTLFCEQCNKTVIRRPANIMSHVFCSQSCSAIYHRPKKYIKVNCKQCNIELPLQSKRKFELNNGNFYCSCACRLLYRRENTKLIKTNCGQCGKEILKKKHYFKQSKSGKVFCGRRCSGVHFGQNKTTGTQVSKFELFVQKELISIFSNLNIEYNNSQTIKSELDIYIPELKLAFEINGPTHYKPIYGQERFNKTIKKDLEKKKNCRKLKIKLIIINTSFMRDGFSEIKSKPFLKKIIKAINKRSAAFAAPPLRDSKTDYLTAKLSPSI